MYSLLISPKGLPCVKSQHSNDYAILIFIGYEERETGTRKAMEEREAEILAQDYEYMLS